MIDSSKKDTMKTILSTLNGLDVVIDKSVSDDFKVIKETVFDMAFYEFERIYNIIKICEQKPDFCAEDALELIKDIVSLARFKLKPLNWYICEHFGHISGLVVDGDDLKNRKVVGIHYSAP